MKQPFILIAIICLLSSCQKIINVDLNSADPLYVVEANLDNNKQLAMVITRTVNFDQSNTFPIVNNASGTLTDLTTGDSDTLYFDGTRTYSASKIVGTPGHTYSLEINVDGHKFVSTSSMPPIVPIDSIKLEKAFFSTFLFAVPYYTDPIATLGNYYKVTQSINGTLLATYDIHSDDVTNGQVAQFPFYYDIGEHEEYAIRSGDTVTLFLRSLDKPAYEFYRTLSETQGQNSVSQTNPLSNIQGGALGYFSAGAVSSKSIIVP